MRYEHYIIEGYPFTFWDGMNGNNGVLVSPEVANLEDPCYLTALEHALYVFNTWQAIRHAENMGPARLLTSQQISDMLSYFSAVDFSLLNNPKKCQQIVAKAELYLKIEAKKRKEGLSREPGWNNKPGRHDAKPVSSESVQDRGYVYLLQSPNGAYKIGFTSDPDNRMKSFGVTLPFDVQYLAIIATDEKRSLEKELHNKFFDKNIRGEWFALDADDVAYIKSLAEGE